jgi:hypothetical protein
MEALARFCRRLAILGVAALIAPVASGMASVATLPNPCTLLSKVHPGTTLAPGKSVVVTQGKLASHGSGNLAISTCSEMVGTLPLNLTFSHSFGGFGGIQVTSITHPSGLGSGDKLVVATSPSGSPVDFIVFHKATVYVDLSANGANPSRLTTLARQVYRLLP